MTLEEIEESWAKDGPIDDAFLDQESTQRTPKLHSRYNNIYNRELYELLNLEKEYNYLRQMMYDMYMYGHNEESRKRGWEKTPLNILKGDYKEYIDNHSDISEIALKVAKQKVKCDFLKSIISSINGRSFQIRDAIEFKKFSNGIK